MKIEKNYFDLHTGNCLFLFLILICMFFGALNLINRYYYCVYIAALLFLITPKRRVDFNFEFLILMIFSIALLVFDPASQNKFTSMIKPFTYPLCYVMGTSIFLSPKPNSTELIQEEKNIANVIYVLSAGTLLHFILNMITNREITDRNVIDFWTRMEMSATGQATLACLMIGVSIAFLFSKVGKTKKFMAVVALVLIVMYNLTLAGRTIFMLIIITAVFALLCTLILTHKRFFKSIIVVVLLVLLVFILYQRDIFGIKTMFETSNFYDRFFDGSYNQEWGDDSRMTHKMAYVKYFFDYPWGGSHIREIYGHSAHDLYFDTYDESGIFAFLAIVIYIVSSLVRMIRCLKSKPLTFKTKLLISCTYLVCNIQFWLEPITRGMPWLLASYCFIDGAVTYLLYRERTDFGLRDRD